MARVIAFGATIYLARVLGVGGYGVVALAAAVTLYLAQFADFGVETLGIREVAEDPEGVRDRAPSILTARLLIAAGLIIVLLPVALLALPQPEGAVIAAYSLTLLPIALSTRWVHLGLESARPVGLARTLGESVMILLVLVLVRRSGDIGSVPLAQFVGESTAVLLLLLLLARRGMRLRVSWDPSRVGPVFRRAWPLVAHGLLGLLIFNSDLVFLRLFRDLASVGHYAAGYTLISFLLNLGVAYGMALLPTMTRLGARTDGERALYHTAQAQVFAAGFPIALGGALLAVELIRQVFGLSYLPAGAALEILIWSIPIALFRNVAVAALVARNRQDQVLRTTTGSTVLNLILNVLLIPRFGILGAAWATVATELLRTVLALRFVAEEGLPFVPFARLIRTLVSGLAMVALLVVVRPANLWVAIALGGIAYLAVLSLLGGVQFRRGQLPALRV
ncbi:MAG: oligosaccharide flippase family protein [Gemmatimonadales bacterium]|nr:oligosaccharide flippase family protein [Gemmatimonadales bacterium]